MDCTFKIGDVVTVVNKDLDIYRKSGKVIKIKSETKVEDAPWGGTMDSIIFWCRLDGEGIDSEAWIPSTYLYNENEYSELDLLDRDTQKAYCKGYLVGANSSRDVGDVIFVPRFKDIEITLECAGEIGMILEEIKEVPLAYRITAMVSRGKRD